MYTLLYQLFKVIFVLFPLYCTAVKSAKRLLRENIPPSGKLNGLALSKALMQYRNTPDRDIGLSPAELLLGRKLRDFLPFRKPTDSLWSSVSSKWKEIADWRELALARRCKTLHDRLNEHTKDLPPLNLGDQVIIQNQLGNNPKRWDRRGIVVQVLPNRQYYVRVDGSRRLTLRNRKFLRKITPVVSRWFEANTPPNLTNYVSKGKQYHPMEEFTPEEEGGKKQHNSTTVTSPVRPAPVSTRNPWYNAPTTPPPNQLSPEIPRTPQNNSYDESRTPYPTISPQTPLTPRYIAPPLGPAAEIEPRRSIRHNRGHSSKYEGYVTGEQYEQATNGRLQQDIDQHAAEQGFYCDALYAVKLPPQHQHETWFWTNQGWVGW